MIFFFLGTISYLIQHALRIVCLELVNSEIGKCVSFGQRFREPQSLCGPEALDFQQLMQVDVLIPVVIFGFAARLGL